MSVSDRSRSASFLFGDVSDRQVVHLSLLGELNPVTLSAAATQTEVMEAVGATHTEGVVTHDSATQALGATSQDCETQTELSLAPQTVF